MFRRLRRACSMVALATLASAGCETTTTPQEPDPPTPTTLSFSGALTIHSATTHRFSTGPGEINVRLKVLAPVETVIIGMALGEWTGATCNIRIADDNAVFNALLIGSATASGEFCARIYDVGKLAEPTDYTIDVTHF